MSVAQLVDLYESLDRPYQLSLDNLSSSPPRKQASYFSLRTNIRTMYGHKRNSSQPSSVRSDSLTTSLPPSACDSPTSLHSSPTFYSSDDSRFQSTTTTSRHMKSLPPFSVNTLQSIMSAPKTQNHSARRPWFTRRALSQIDLALESESRAEGIENLGLGLFEPRPRETTVSRQSSQGSVVLDGILEVMESAE